MSATRTSAPARKPTILDILTTLDVSPAILMARADYYDTMADRNERAGRDEQVKRLRKNILAMRNEAKRLQKMTRTVNPSRALIANALTRARIAKPAKRA